MAPSTSTLRVFHPAANVFAFYDGRVPGRRAYSTEPNWLDDGAYALGICSYAIVDGEQALIYDTHISLAHARAIRTYLESLGVREMRVVLSHWHDDHVAGNEVFSDCEIIAHWLTAEILTERQVILETGNPPIFPLIHPNRTWEGELDLDIGGVRVQLRHADIHSRDGTVLVLPAQRLLFAGDCLEDTITYVAEPDRLEIHAEALRAMSKWKISSIYPNHGSPDRIEHSGYPVALVDATMSYVEKLCRCPCDAELAALDLHAFAAESLAAGAITYFPPYEAVHRRNVEAVCSEVR